MSVTGRTATQSTEFDLRRSSMRSRSAYMSPTVLWRSIQRIATFVRARLSPTPAALITTTRRTLVVGTMPITARAHGSATCSGIARLRRDSRSGLGASPATSARGHCDNCKACKRSHHAHLQCCPFPVVASRHTCDESAGRGVRNPTSGFRELWSPPRGVARVPRRGLDPNRRHRSGSRPDPRRRCNWPLPI